MISTAATGAEEGPFKVDELIAAAAKAAAVGDASILDTAGLRALSHGLARAADKMNAMAQRRAQKMLVETLVKRLRLDYHLGQDPTIREIELKAPILLVAPFRSGTTLLHRLLAQDPAHRTPRLWEALQAAPIDAGLRGDPAYFEKDPRVDIARTYLKARAMFTPDIAAIHPTDVDAPEECFGLLETSLLSHSFTFYGPVLEYLDWLDQRSREEWDDAYALYADQIRLLQWWAPGERWVLKTPFHIWAVDTLADTFPDALIVQQHRTPAACVASYCSLITIAYGPMVTGVDNHQIGRIALRFLHDGLSRNVAARKQMPAERFIDIDFNDLVSDPIGCVHRVYEAAGSKLSADTENHIRRWHEAQARDHRKTSHSYSLADYGLDQDEVNEAFEPYAQFNR